MPRLRYRNAEDGGPTGEQTRTAIPFPKMSLTSTGSPIDAASEVFDAFEEVSRRMEDLARELGCLGFFDGDDDDRPRAA